jgi:uncharacterized membrane protein
MLTIRDVVEFRNKRGRITLAIFRSVPWVWTMLLLAWAVKCFFKVLKATLGGFTSIGCLGLFRIFSAKGMHSQGEASAQ